MYHDDVKVNACLIFQLRTIGVVHQNYSEVSWLFSIILYVAISDFYRILRRTKTVENSAVKRFIILIVIV